MTHHASGPFEVKITPRAATDTTSPVAFMSLDKQYAGDLVAEAQGDMMATFTESTGARAYVALERVTGTLSGRAGSFDLAHRGTMTKDGQELVIIIVPESGTGALTGISGTVTINIVEKKHFYTVDYSLD